MSPGPTYELVPIGELHAHERTDPSAVRHLIAEFRATGIFSEPIWVARGSLVILNGHHRWTALRELGAQRIPAWMFDYVDDPEITLDHWGSGPPIAKSEVVRRATAGELFPVKTTRHILPHPLPDRPTPLALLFDGPIPAPLAKGSGRAAQK